MTKKKYIIFGITLPFIIFILCIIYAFTTNYDKGLETRHAYVSIFMSHWMSIKHDLERFSQGKLGASDLEQKVTEAFKGEEKFNRIIIGIHGELIGVSNDLNTSVTFIPPTYPEEKWSYIVTPELRKIGSQSLSKE